jgi:hypothetical protein
MPGYAVRTVCVGFMVNQVALRQFYINVFQSSVNYFTKSLYTVCAIESKQWSLKVLRDIVSLKYESIFSPKITLV